MLNKFYKEHEEIINYLVVGILSVIISLVIKNGLLFTILNPKNYIDLQLSVIISWIIAVSFSYITNRIYVFKSISNKYIKEIISFVGGRIFTLLCDMFVMWFICTFLNLNTKVWTILASLISLIVVVILNYFISKIYVFKKREEVK